MIRWFWRIYIPVALLALLGIATVSIGPALEGRFAPIRIDQRIENVVRTPDRLCWDWVSVKVRARVSDNMDVYLVTPTDRDVVSIFERDTGEPWGRSRAVGLGPHRQFYCVQLPPSVYAWTPIRVTQVAYYPGWLGLWHVAVEIPDVVDPPDASVP